MPLRETAYQGYTFLALMDAGALSLLLFDLLSPALNARFWLLRLLSHMLLCAAAACLCFAALALTQCGQIRGYMLLALLLGGVVYRLGLSRLIRALIKLLRRDRSLPKRRE